MIAGHRVLDGGHCIPIADGLCHISGQESVEKAGIVCVARTDPINQLQVNLRAAGVGLTIIGDCYAAPLAPQYRGCLADRKRGDLQDLSEGSLLSVVLCLWSLSLH